MDTIHVEFNPYDISTIRFIANVQNCNVGTVSKEFEQILHNATYAQLTHVRDNYDNLEVASQRELKLNLIREEINRKKRIQKPLVDAGIPILGHSKAVAEKQAQQTSVLSSKPKPQWCEAMTTLTGEKERDSQAKTGSEPADEDLKELRPDYYGGEQNPFEPFKIIEYYNLSFFAGNVLKYLLRAGVKDKSKHLEDLRKALTYLVREILIVKKKTNKEPVIEGSKIENYGLYSERKDSNSKKIHCGDIVSYKVDGKVYLPAMVTCKNGQWKIGGVPLGFLRSEDLTIIAKYDGGSEVSTGVKD